MDEIRNNFTISGWSEVLRISLLTLVTMITEIALWMYRSWAKDVIWSESEGG